jgi:hypothetical protein
MTQLTAITLDSTYEEVMKWLINEGDFNAKINETTLVYTLTFRKNKGEKKFKKEGVDLVKVTTELCFEAFNDCENYDFD